jgi:hypothetical protein
MKTMTIIELMMALHQLVKDDKKIADYKVVIGRDPEGNGYGTIDPKYSFQFGDLDKVLSIMPSEQYEGEEVFPLEDAKIMKGDM